MTPTRSANWRGLYVHVRRLFRQDPVVGVLLSQQAEQALVGEGDHRRRIDAADDRFEVLGARTSMHP